MCSSRLSEMGFLLFAACCINAQTLPSQTIHQTGSLAPRTTAQLASHDGRGSLAAMKFVDISATAGIGGLAEHGGHAILFADVNSDGFDDMYVTHTNFVPDDHSQFLVLPDELFINNGDNTFTEIAVSAGVDDPGQSHGAVFADMDNDGDFDLFNGQRGPHGNRLYRNYGNGIFTEITGPAGILLEDRATIGAIAFDLDNDGDQDLFSGNWGKGNEMYVNDGSGHFTLENRGATDSEPDPAGKMAATAADVDNDDDLDLFVAKRYDRCRLYLNDGHGFFADQAAARGLDYLGISDGAVFVDLDRDADLDMLLATYVDPGELTKLRLYRNTGNDFFVDETDVHDIPFSGYAVNAGDLNNDGYPDIFVAINFGESSLWLNDGSGHFVKQSGTGLERTGVDARAATFADIDNDGDLDVAITYIEEETILFRNDLNTSTNAKNFLQFSVTPPAGSAGGFGTKFYLYQAGHLDDPLFLQGYQQLLASTGTLSQNAPRAHFGVSAAQHYDLRVRFLEGGTVALTDIVPGQHIHIDGEPDTKAPLLESIDAAVSPPANATITWITNETSDSQVEYGLTTSYGSSSPLNPALVTAHSVTLSGLSANTTYHYRVKSQDAAGNLAVSSDFTFTTIVTANLKARVEIDPYDQWEFFTCRVFNHSESARLTVIKITGVDQGTFDLFYNGSKFTVSPDLGENNDTKYAKQVTLTFSGAGLGAGSSDHNGQGSDLDWGTRSLTVEVQFNQGTVLTGSFANVHDSDDGNSDLWVAEVEAASGDTEPPVISNVSSSNLSATGATITWITNETSDSQVEYGLTTGYGSSSPLNPALVTAHSVALSGLSANTTYHYRVKSQDAAGNLAVSGDFTFTSASDWIEKIVLNDPLHNGTLGSRTGGQFLSGGGWQVTGEEDMIVYDLGRYMRRGEVELELRNFIPNPPQAFARHHFLAMFRQPLANHLCFEELETTWDLHAGLNYNGGVELWSRALSDTAHATTIPTGWNAQQTYHLRIVWNGKELQYFRNDTLQATHVHADDMAPRYLYLGRELTVALDMVTGFKHNQYPALTGPIYANLIVKEQVPAADASPPTVGSIEMVDLYANGARLGWSTNEPAVCYVEYGPTPAYGQKTAVLGPPDITFTTVLPGLIPNQTYHYRIVALDEARHSTATPDNAFTTAIKGRFVFAPSADACVAQGVHIEHGNFGWMFVAAGEDWESYLRFPVSGTNGEVTSAKLRLFARQSGSGSGTWHTLNAPWEENTVTWLTKPAVNGPVVGTLEGIQVGQWHETEMAEIVTGDGTHNFALVGAGAPVASFDSRESTNNQPELIIEVDEAMALYEVYEVTLTAANAGNLPYRNGPAVTVTFTGTSGAALGKSLAVKGFWDGGAIYRARFAPMATGEWVWQSSSSDAGLNGKSGSFSCSGRLPANHASAHGHLHESTAFPYTFEDGEGNAIFLMGDTQWAFCTDSVSWPGEFQTYVNARAEQGFNYVHGILYLTYVSGNEGGPTFFSNHVDSLNPGFWQMLDKRISYMNTKGIVAGLVLAWGNEGWQNFSTQTQVDRYIRYVVDRYAAYNVIWITSGEYEEGAPPGGHYHVGEFVHFCDPYAHPVTTHTVNTSADGFGNAPWHTTIYQQTPDIFLVTADRHFNKPVINAEFGYEGKQSAEEVRRDAWEIVMRGGFFVYGDTMTYHMNARMTPENLHSPGATFMSLLKSFWTNNGLPAVAWQAFSRFDSLGQARWLCGNPGVEYVVYVDNPTAFTVNLAEASGVVEGQWFNTRTGEWGSTFSGAATSSFALTPPAGGFAAYLRIGSNAGSLPPVSQSELAGAGSVVRPLPERFGVSQNYPNPFNLVTRFELALPEQGRVKAVLYDTQGQEVARLWEANLAAGYHALAWGGRNAQGQEVSSGVYLLRLVYRAPTHDTEVLVKRVLLVK